MDRQIDKREVCGKGRYLGRLVENGLELKESYIDGHPG